MNGQIWGFVIAIALIMLGIIFSRTDAKELRAEISQLRTEMHTNFVEFYRTLGQHDAKIENLEKRR
ncbi:MAG: hypothetical protein WAL85_01960 [Candidatus Korobacteraceae bacterium]|jgi:hypothetical protein